MEENDVVAVTRVREGDSDAFRLLVERHSRSVFRMVYRMVGSKQDAEDIVQETFLRAFRKLDGFEERANFGTWLYRIAANCTIDWIRRRRVHEPLNENVELDSESAGSRPRSFTSGPDRILERMELRRRVEKALGELSAMERAAFVLRHFEGMTIEEISDTLGLGDSAAKQGIFRAVRKMRRALEPVAGLTE